MKEIVNILIALLVCGNCFPCCGQTIAREDTLQVRKLVTAANDSAGTNPAKCMELAQEAIVLSGKLNYPTGIAGGLLMIGRTYSRAGKPADAIKAYSEALKIAQENGLHNLETKAYDNLGSAYDDIGDYEQAKEYYELSFKLNEAYPDSMNLSHTYFNYGMLLNRMKDYENGLKYMLKAAELTNALHSYDGLQIIYSDIAENYLSMNRYRDAFIYLYKSLRLSDSLHEIDNLPYTYTTLGTCYDHTGHQDSALYYYNKSLIISRALDDKVVQVQALSYTGEIYANLGKPDSAEKYCLQAFALAKIISDRNALYNIAYDLSRVYASEHNYKESYGFLDIAFKSKDSLLNESTEKAMGELALRYNTRELENKNQLLLKESDLQKMHLQRKNILIYGSISAFIALLAISLLLIRQSKLKANQQRVELEQKQLRAQMNPHFIFNCLNSIQHFVVANDVKNANKYLSGFAALMRQTLENSKEGSITLRREIAYLENYLTLELMRFEDKFSYEIICADNINIDSVEIPAMIIQPFIENAIRHGLCFLKDRKGKLTIRFYQQGMHLFCEIDDNGIGREQSQKLKMGSDMVYESHGMELTRQRLALVSKSNGSDYEIEIKDKKNEADEPAGTRVIIKFPTDK